MMVWEKENNGHIVIIVILLWRSVKVYLKIIRFVVP